MFPFLPAFLDRAMTRAFSDAVAASAEALFPEGDPDLPGARGTDLAARTTDYVLGLPPSQRPLVALLFVAVEWLTIVLAPFGGRFSRRPAADRLAIVEGWRLSWIYPVRLMGDALRATLCMAYASHPDVLRAIGEPPEGGTLVEAS